MNLPLIEPTFLLSNAVVLFFVGSSGSINIANAEILKKASLYLRYSGTEISVLLLIFWPEMVSRIASTNKAAYYFLAKY